jgi:hypothetical protein
MHQERWLCIEKKSMSVLKAGSYRENTGIELWDENQ